MRRELVKSQASNISPGTTGHARAPCAARPALPCLRLCYPGQAVLARSLVKLLQEWQPSSNPSRARFVATCDQDVHSDGDSTRRDNHAKGPKSWAEIVPLAVGGN